MLDQTCGSGFLCASDVALGDAIEKLRKLEKENSENKNLCVLKQAAKILRDDAKQCKKDQKDGHVTEVSTEAASKLIPHSYHFLTYLLTDRTRTLDPGESRLPTSHAVEEKILIMAQQILQHVSGIVTPLSLCTGYHLTTKHGAKS